MLKFLETYLDLNEIYFKEKTLEVGHIIEKTPNIKIHNYSRKGFILEYYQKLLNKQVDIETFMTLGDANSSVNVHVNKNPIFESLADIHGILEKTPKEFQDSIILVEKESIIYFQNKQSKDYESLQKALKLVNANMIEM